MPSTSCAMHRQLLQRLAQSAREPLLPRPRARVRLCLHYGPRPAPFRIAARSFSTSALLRQEQQQSPPPPSTAADAIPPPPSPKPPRPRPRWFSAVVFLLVGAISGTLIRAVVAPPAPPVAGSPVDLGLREDIQKMALKLPIVQELLADPGCK